MKTTIIMDKNDFDGEITNSLYREEFKIIYFLRN